MVQLVNSRAAEGRGRAVSHVPEWLGEKLGKDLGQVDGGGSKKLQRGWEAAATGPVGKPVCLKQSVIDCKDLEQGTRSAAEIKSLLHKGGKPHSQIWAPPFNSPFYLRRVTLTFWNLSFFITCKVRIASQSSQVNFKDEMK